MYPELMKYVLQTEIKAEVSSQIHPQTSRCIYEKHHLSMDERNSSLSKTFGWVKKLLIPQ